jgi:hypothetical protein
MTVVPRERGKGAIMITSEWLSMLKAEREREMKAAQRAHLVDRSRTDEIADGDASAVRDQSIGRIVRPAAQPRATADPSL